MVGDRGLQSRATPSGRRKFSAATPQNEHEIAIYNSNVTVSTAFWDWRHKALTLYLSLITAIGGIVAWLYPKSPHQPYVGLPLIAASGISYIAYRWDRRIREIIDMSVESCANMEEHWCAEGGIEELDNRKILSVFTMLQNQNLTGKGRTFSRTIPVLFGAIGVGSLILACLIFTTSGA